MVRDFGLSNSDAVVKINTFSNLMGRHKLKAFDWDIGRVNQVGSYEMKILKKVIFLHRWQIFLFTRPSLFSRKEKNR